MSVSACLITWNEEEMLPYCLKYLDSLEYLNEICLVDSNSTDRTQDIIKEFIDHTKKTVHFISKKFENFRIHKNKSLDLATGDWILIIDADETYSQKLDELLVALNSVWYNPQIIAVRIPTLVMTQDRRHYLNKSDSDPHIRLFRQGFARYERDVHESLIDIYGRNLHITNAGDILNTWDYENYKDVWLKHYQLLKSDKSLFDKGARWKELGLIEKSIAAGIPIAEDSWWKAKYNEVLILEINELPEKLYDVTTERG